VVCPPIPVTRPACHSILRSREGGTTLNVRRPFQVRDPRLRDLRLRAMRSHR
jgi:hypothetical protein